MMIVGDSEDLLDSKSDILGASSRAANVSRFIQSGYEGLPIYTAFYPCRQGLEGPLR